MLRERRKTSRHWTKRVSAYRLFSDAAALIANSDWTATLAQEVMREVGVTTPPPVAAIDLGTDPDQFRPERNTGELRGKLGIGASPIMLTVARLVPHKGQDTAIHALGLLRDEFPDLQYVIVGKGDDELRLRSLSTALGVAERVHLVGHLDDASLADAYATASLYVGLSRLDNSVNVEGFGISFVEAAASGVPSVAGNSGGVRSAVRDGETGIVVDASDASAAASAIRTLIGDTALRSRIGVAARSAVATHFNWDRVASETRAFVHQCIASGRTRTERRPPARAD